jgi:preprotein translocase subunit SecG
MITVLLVLHVLVTVALIGVVLIQRSEGGGLGLGTSQGMGSFMTGRGTANLLTRTTAILAAAFFILSLALALLYRGGSATDVNAILGTQASHAPAAPGSSLPSVPADARPANGQPANGQPANGQPGHSQPAAPAAPNPASPVPVPSAPAAPAKQN